MSEPEDETHLREHFAQLRKAIRGVGKDVEIDLTDAPHLAKEGAKNALASAAGVRRKALKEWTPPE